VTRSTSLSPPRERSIGEARGCEERLVIAPWSADERCESRPPGGRSRRRREQPRPWLVARDHGAAHRARHLDVEGGPLEVFSCPECMGSCRADDPDSPLLRSWWVARQW